MQPTNTAPPDLSDFLPFKRFALEYEKRGLGTEDSLRWLVRYRSQNGLLASGAIIELKSPTGRRPRLMVNRPRFAAWLAGEGRTS